jgi:lipopolysaccharide/colanic/teichoic acid biosynthesis glycosyltransferase
MKMKLLWRARCAGEGPTLPPLSGNTPREGGRLGYRLAKRVLDVCLSFLGMVLLAPVLAAIAVAVKVSSPGPALFCQVRVGRGGRPFTLYKFRSMRFGAAGPTVTPRGDFRVTRVGRLLRATKLDELPQLWNVFVGDMSLVGPRPQTLKYFETHRDGYARILRLLRPGVTDYATIKYRNEEAIVAALADPEREYVEKIIPDKLRLQHLYLSRFSLRTDLNILLQTMLAIMPVAGQWTSGQMDPAWIADGARRGANRPSIQ